MSIANPAKEAHAQEERHGQSSMHEAVVHDHVGEAEGGHAGADPDGNRRRSSVQITSNHHQCGSDRRVQHGQRVVAFEPTDAARVVGSMHPVEPAMPDAPMEHACPWLHGSGHHEGHAHSQRDGRGCRHEEAS